jgi:hypothetical protein
VISARDEEFLREVEALDVDLSLREKSPIPAVPMELKVWAVGGFCLLYKNGMDDAGVFIKRVSFLEFEM